jgi:hypothetical protein
MERLSRKSCRGEEGREGGREERKEGSDTRWLLRCVKPKHQSGEVVEEVLQGGRREGGREGGIRTKQLSTTRRRSLECTEP